MADELPIPNYTLLPPRNAEDPAEPPMYDCSLCDDDVINISMHSQFAHGVRQFTVNHEETPRDYGVVGALCGVNGCSFDGNHEGRHSWEPKEVSDAGDHSN